MPNSALLDAAGLRTKITELLSEDVDCVFLSAFFTFGAAEYLNKLVPTKKLRVAIRGRPLDFKFGASDTNAVRRALDLGWDIRFISALHAKAYLIGDKILIGSGNLTGNGLHLLGEGNLELNCLVEATRNSTKVIEAIFSEATRFNLKILEEMEKYVEALEANTQNTPDWWPENVLITEKRKMFCCDFPQFPADALEIDAQPPWTQARQQLANGDVKAASELLANTQAIVWLKSSIKGRDAGVRFGELTAKLHDDLAEEPAPYRREVKQLLANLLSYIKSCPDLGVRVTRPSHTEVVQLI